MIPKHNHIRCKAIRDAANGEDCTICGINDASTVFAHLDELWAGKGIGIKADDLGGGFFACYKCHQSYDGKLGSIPDWMVMRAVYRTIRRLYELGIILIKNDKTKKG